MTDEIFAISAAGEGYLSPYYSYGAIAVAAPGWTLGTLLGVLLGNVLPGSLNNALGVALYAMFLAIILPPAGKNRVIAGVVGISMAASAALELLVRHFALTALTSGFRIILLTVVIAALAAWLFPVKEASEEGEV